MTIMHLNADPPLAVDTTMYVVVLPQLQAESGHTKPLTCSTTAVVSIDIRPELDFSCAGA